MDRARFWDDGAGRRAGLYKESLLPFRFIFILFFVSFLPAVKDPRYSHTRSTCRDNFMARLGEFCAGVHVCVCVCVNRP